MKSLLKAAVLGTLLTSAAWVSGAAAAAPTDIKTVQTELKNAGFNPGAIDGKFGKHTMIAVKEFQNARKLPVTGHLNTKTLDALKA